jgi:hypothetical protein
MPGKKEQANASFAEMAGESFHRFLETALADILPHENGESLALQGMGKIGRIVGRIRQGRSLVARVPDDQGHPRLIGFCRHHLWGQETKSRKESEEEQSDVIHKLPGKGGLKYDRDGADARVNPGWWVIQGKRLHASGNEIHNNIMGFPAQPTSCRMLNVGCINS